MLLSFRLTFYSPPNIPRSSNHWRNESDALLLIKYKIELQGAKVGESSIACRKALAKLDQCFSVKKPDVTLEAEINHVDCE
jgi:hypothetical protein